MEALLGEPWLWVPTVSSLLAPPAARWRPWAGWTVWALSVVVTGTGFLLVGAATVLLGLFASLFGFAPDWGSAAGSFAAPATLSLLVLAASWYVTRRTAAATRG